MSFILNALRKSAKDRKSIQPQSLDVRIQEKPNNTKNKSVSWLIPSILLNFIILSVLAWLFFFRLNSDTDDKKPRLITKNKTTIPSVKIAKPIIIRK